VSDVLTVNKTLIQQHKSMLSLL